jgi:hypothetical protein
MREAATVSRRRQKHQIPSTKFQTMTQTQSTNFQNGWAERHHGRLGHCFIGVLNLFGICDLEFGISTLP